MGRGKAAKTIKLDKDIYELLEADHPLSLRMIYYRLEALGKIAKTKEEYSRCYRRAKELRVEGTMPFEWMVDITRWVRTPPNVFSDVGTVLDVIQRSYRRDFWQDQPKYVKVWIEKASLVFVVEPLAHKYGLPLCCNNGYSSMSYLFVAGQRLKDITKPVHLLYIGDHDPSGINAREKTKAGILKHAPNIDLHFVEVAVKQTQISQLSLLTRDTNKNDPRYKMFIRRGYTDSCEVEAIHKDVLRDLLEEEIKLCINKKKWKASVAKEAADKAILETIYDDYQEMYG